MMKLILKLFGLLCVALTLTGAVDKQFDGRLYVSTDTLTLAWDAQKDATRYEIRAIDVLHNPQQVIDLGRTQGPLLVINRLRPSIWVYQVRACNDNGCSDWASSDDKTYATVDGRSEKWRVYWKLPEPAGGRVVGAQKHE